MVFGEPPQSQPTALNIAVSVSAMSAAGLACARVAHEQYGHLVWKFDVVPKTGPARATWTNPKFPISR